MKKLVYIFFLIVWNFAISAQNSWYVDQMNGAASNDGKLPGSAFNDFDLATGVVSPGDTIFIIGEYHNQSYDPDYSYGASDDAMLWNGENSINVTGLHGTESGYITITSYKGYPDRPAIIKGDGANILRVRDCSYLIIKDLEIEGEVNRIPLSTAEALQFVYIIADENLKGRVKDPAPEDIRHRDEEGSNPDGIFEDETYPDISKEPVKRPSYIDTRGMYFSVNIDHVKIINNHIHHTPGVGMKVANSHYVTISGNEIHDCSRKSYSGTHALVVTKTLPGQDGDTVVVISNNKIHHNYNEIFSWSIFKTIITPRIDEGKGISLQRNDTDEWLNGAGRILVVNNVCYWNGYAGIHSNDGFRIDFINNTCFMNSYTNTVTYSGTDMQSGNNIGISAQGGGDIRMINNISVIDTDWGGYALSAAGVNGSLTVENNIISGINGKPSQDKDVKAVQVSTLVADPLFKDAPADYRDENYNFDLKLTSGSPAIGYANATYAPVCDFNDSLRDDMPDSGALEYFSVSAIHDNNRGKVKVYPTLFDEKITVEKEKDHPMKVSLLSITGDIIFEVNMGEWENKTEIRTGGLIRGVYIVKAGTRSFKLIKK